MSVRAQMVEIIGRPAPEVRHYDPSDIDALMTPRPTPAPVPGTLQEKKPRKPRGPSKKSLLEAEYARGLNDGAMLGRDKDRAPTMLGNAILMMFTLAAGVAVGAVIF